jgi:hypothetical protein
MKISKEDFESMKAKYDKEVKNGKTGKGSKGKDKTNQTSWIFFDRETLEGLLAKASKDPKVGGIQFYFTEFTEETAKKVYPNEAEEYTGQMTLIMKAANLNEVQLASKKVAADEEEYVAGGSQCPYRCEPGPTNP